MNKIICLALIFSLLFAVVMEGAQASPSEKRVIIQYKSGVTGKDIADLQKIGAKIKHRHTIISAVTADLRQDDIDRMRKDKNVKSVIEDTRVHLLLNGSTPQIGADLVHSSGASGAGVKICIVDTGVDDSHPALGKLVAEYDFINMDNDASDDNGHGTHVAGIIASKDPVYRGVAYSASLMAAKVLDSSGSGWTSDVVTGIEWCAANGADIITMSLGGGSFTGTCDTEPTAEAGNIAAEQGVVVFAASGNSATTNALSAPACGSKVISVGSVDKKDIIAPYSNEGKELDIVAPGTSITSTYPGGGFKTYSGTSMATPHAAATAALILEADPSLSPKDVRSILRETSIDLGTPGFDSTYGYGRINAFSAVSYLRLQPVREQIFFDNMENLDFTRFVESNELDWRITAPKEINVPDAPKGNLVAHADMCTSSGGCILTLKDPVNLSRYKSATLKFSRYIDNDLDNGEYLRVQASSGAAWATIYEWTNGKGDDDTWHQESFNLSSYLVDGFKIRFISKESSSSEETEIDDIQIKGILKQQGNQPPVADAGPDINISDSDSSGFETVALDASASQDPDGTIVSYQWKEGDTILGASALIVANLSVGTHIMELTVADDNNATAYDSIIVTISSNIPPVAGAGPDRTMMDSDENSFETVSLDASSSKDPDGTIDSYEWSEGGSVIGNSMITDTNLTIGVHNITLAVTDNGGASGTDYVLITVIPYINQPPVADAGFDRAYNDSDGTGDENMTLDGSSSYDPDGTIVSYKWNEDGALIGTDVKISGIFAVGTHAIILEVTDDKGASSSDEVTITVNPNQPPIANAGPDKTSLFGTAVNFNGSASLDPDGSITAYNWDFQDSSTSSLMSTSHNYTAPGAYSVTLTVTDSGGLSSFDTMTVTITANSEPLPDVRITSMYGRNAYIGSNYQVNAYIKNYDLSVQTVDAHLAIFDPAGNEVSWPGLTDKSITLGQSETKSASWKNTIPAGAFLGTYSARLSVQKGTRLISSTVSAFTVK